MDPDLTLEARRLFVSTTLTAQSARLLRGRVDPGSRPTDLIIVARHLAEDIDTIERRYDLRFEPPYPGVTGGVEQVGDNLRLVLACAVFGEGPLGVVFTVLISGRRPQVSVAPVGTRIPTGWRRLSELG